MRVSCAVERDEGARVVRVRCGRCGTTTESRVGDDEDRSVRRCLAMLREGCPEEGDNFYVTGEGGHEVGGYENLVSSGKAPRGREVELLVKDKPLRPPSRRPE